MIPVRNLITQNLSEKDKNKTEKIPRDTAVMRPYSENLLRISDTVFLKKFDATRLEVKNDGFRVGVLGTSGSGKTSFLKDHILSLPCIYKIPYWVVVNPSEDENRAYTPFFENDLMIGNELDDIIPAINNLKTRQKAVLKEWLIDGESFPKKYKADVRAGIIIDDASENQKIYNEPIWGWLYQNSRNAKVLAFHLVQYQKTLCPKFRRQLSHLILFEIKSPKEIESVYREFGGNFFQDLNEFKQAHDIATEGNAETEVYKCMIIDVQGKSRKLEDRVFWHENTHQEGKPKYPKLGAKWFQKYQKELYNPEWNQNAEMYENYEAPVKGKKAGKKTRKIVIDN